MNIHSVHHSRHQGLRLTAVAGAVLALAAATAQAGHATVDVRAEANQGRAQLADSSSASAIAAERSAAINAALRANHGTLPQSGSGTTAQRPVTPTTPNIPQVTGPIARTATSIPIGTAYFPGAPGSVNLADHGYLEEEFFVSGTANVYQYDSTGQKVEIKTPNVPYTTVILVRMPADPRKFSGRVQLEMSHPQFGVTTQVWAHNSAKIMADGDAWVRVTNSRGGMAGSSLGVAQQYNPQRYAALNFSEDGLNWDVIGQIAGMLKTNASVSCPRP